MKVYHGSYAKIENPDLAHTRTNIDFGAGFYLTEDKGMAMKWAANKSVSIVNEYELNLEGLHVIRLGLTKQWLDFVAYNRGYEGIKFNTEGIDVIIGPTADDKLFKTLDTYFDGLITDEQAIRYLNIAGFSNQIVLKTEKALSQLIYTNHKTLNENQKNSIKKQANYERIVANTALLKMLELDRKQTTETITLQGDSEYDNGR